MSVLTAFWDQLASVLHSFRQHKARAFLTLLGMIIGAGSVVLLSGLLKGGEEALTLANQFIDENDVIEVETGDPPPRQRDRTQRPLDHADQQSLDHSPAAGGPAEGELMDWNKYAYFGSDKKRVMVLGASDRALDMYRVKLQQDRFIDPTDLLRRSRVCVVGFEVWQELLGAPADLTGKSVRINNVRWEVVGVLAHKAPFVAGPGTWMWDRRIVVPETTFQGVIRHSRKVDTIYIRVLPTLGEITQQVTRARTSPTPA